VAAASVATPPVAAAPLDPAPCGTIFFNVHFDVQYFGGLRFEIDIDAFP
jgi:hypothetical protein